ncbi:MAG: hypothetical protein KatS3mg099_245 [Candidatus Parcubacteria bacterium]|nr:MAG: hypothetical protein KatS3mg099_245 [Candidatus Parcubacteria bacterium]
MPPQPRLRYRLPTALMVPILIFALVVESAQFLFFGVIIGATQTVVQTVKEVGEAVEFVLEGVQAVFLAMSVVSAGLCVVSAGFGCVGSILFMGLRKIAMKVVSFFISESLKKYAKEIANGALRVFSVMFTMLSALVWIGVFVGFVLFFSLRGVSPMSLWRKNPGATAGMIVVENLPYVGMIVPTITIWLWRVWRRTRKEDEEKYQKERERWLEEFAAWQAQMNQMLTQQLALEAAARKQLAERASRRAAQQNAQQPANAPRLVGGASHFAPGAV